MKNNTVTLDLETYNRLRDFKNAMEGGLTSVMAYDYYGNLRTKYVSNDKAVKLLDDENEELTTANNLLLVRNSKLNEELENIKKQIKGGTIKIRITNPTVCDFNKMSVWQFIKYKRKLK